MSDAAPSAEIEDVLLSIRRLVQGEPARGPESASTRALEQVSTDDLEEAEPQGGADSAPEWPDLQDLADEPETLREEQDVADEPETLREELEAVGAETVWDEQEVAGEPETLREEQDAVGAEIVREEQADAGEPETVRDDTALILTPSLRVPEPAQTPEATDEPTDGAPDASEAGQWFADAGVDQDGDPPGAAGPEEADADSADDAFRHRMTFEDLPEFQDTDDEDTPSPANVPSFVREAVERRNKATATWFEHAQLVRSGGAPGDPTAQQPPQEPSSHGDEPPSAPAGDDAPSAFRFRTEGEPSVHSLPSFRHRGKEPGEGGAGHPDPALEADRGEDEPPAPEGVVPILPSFRKHSAAAVDTAPANTDTGPAASGSDAEAGLGGSGIDPETLSALISECVHRELQGELGERITRNVRKLVRREIHRALSMRDFD